jgi:hypothetical protein
VDIRIGAATPVGRAPDKAGATIDVVEAKVLALRPPRARPDGPPAGRADQRRPDSPDQDPPGARILVLMVLDGARLPKDLQTHPYRVFIRFARR